MNLLFLLSWPYFRNHLIRTALTLAGVALGVAVFVAMHAANERVFAAFVETLDRIAGNTDLQVTSGENGFGEETLDTVQSVRSVAVAVPVIEAVVDAGVQGTLLVLGVDMTGDRSLRKYDMEGDEESALDDPLIFLAQPDSIVVSRSFADRNGLRSGSRLTLGTADGDKTFTVRGIMKSSHLADAFGGNLAVMDVYAAQMMFGRGRTFDRIDVAKKPSVSLEASQRDLASALGPGFDIQPPASRGRHVESVLAGYRTMVDISSAFALFIGMFIVYNSFAVAVTERRKDIGVLRALGATRAQIRMLFLGESAALGLAGSVVGVAVGAIAASVVAGAVSRLAGDVYGIAQGGTDAGIHAAIAGAAVLLGVASSMVSSLVPAMAAARVDPVDALRKGSYQQLSEAESRRRIVLGCAFGAVSALCMIGGSSRAVLYGGYAAAILTALLFGPVAAYHLTRLLRPLLQWLSPVEGSLAADSLRHAPRRTSATVAALMLSLALVVAFAGIARASYVSIMGWLDTSLNADLFVMPSPRLDLRTIRFPSTMKSEIAAVPGVARVQLYRNGRINFRGAPAMLVAIEMASVAETNRRAPVAGDSQEMYRKAGAGEGLLVSDSLAQLRHLALGEEIEIPSPQGMIRLPIVGIVLDYTDQQGSILIDRRVFLDGWRDDSVSDFRVFVSPHANIPEVARRISGLYAGRRTVFVLSNAEGRKYIVRLLDQWFGLMNVQIAIAVLVAVLGIFTTLTVSITDRRRELGIMRALGALPTQIRRTIWLEALTVGALGLALGLALGGVNLFYLLRVVQRDIAGFRFEYQFPVATAAWLMPVMLAAALAAAIWPAEAAVRDSLVEALEYE